MTMTKLSENVKVAEAASILDVSKGTARAWAESGRRPVRRNPDNGDRLFQRADLEKFLGEIENSVEHPTVRQAS